MGGPFWSHRDERAWSLPKGEHGTDEGPLDAARREFEEEIGTPAPPGEPLDLGEVRQRSGKVVHAFALAGDLDVASVHSNLVVAEWPRGSGRTITFPEVDRAAWFAPDVARLKMVAAQAAFVDRLLGMLGEAPSIDAAR